jgi:hypothetical protein
MVEGEMDGCGWMDVDGGEWDGGDWMNHEVDWRS